MPVKTLGWVLVLAYATAAGAQSATIEFDVTGEHRMTTGDTAESARQLALVDARRKAWETAALRLQDRCRREGTSSDTEPDRGLRSDDARDPGRARTELR